MSDRKRQRYTASFKAEIEGDRTAAAVARELGVRADLLRKWKQEQRAAGVGTEPARALTESERVRQLERELAVVRQERDSSKKPRRSSRGGRREVRVHSPAPGGLPAGADVPGRGGPAQQLLRLAGAGPEPAGPGQCRAARPDSGALRRE
jgi:transposase